MQDKRSNAATRFKPGQSGNPTGKKPGTKNRLTRVWAERVEEEAGAAFDALAKAARRGDVHAAMFLVRQARPARRGGAVAVELPPLAKPDDLVPAIAAVVGHVASGRISPEEGALIAGMLETQRRIVEQADHEARIAALESVSKRRRR
jgi:hypothetical protein